MTAGKTPESILEQVVARTSGPRGQSMDRVLSECFRELTPGKEIWAGSASADLRESSGLFAGTQLPPCPAHLEEDGERLRKPKRQDESKDPTVDIP